MAMLKKRLLIKALIHELPKLVGRQNGKFTYSQNLLIEEMTKLYGQLGLFDHIIDKMKVGGIL